MEEKKYSSHTNSTHHIHPGNFGGHVVPGSLFLLVSLWYSLHGYYHYYKARKHSAVYKATFSRNIWFCRRAASRTHLEAVIRIVLVLSGISGELITMYDRATGVLVNQFMHAEHITMYCGFGLSGLVDLLMYYEFGCLTDGADYFCGLLAFIVEGVLFLYHLHGRTTLNTHIHTLLIMVIGGSCLSVIAEYLNRDKFIWSLPRLTLLWLQGTWFWQIAFTLFSPYQTTTKLSEEDPESIMVMTLYFAGHMILAVLVQFFIGSLVYIYHGRPRMTRQSKEYLKLSSDHSTITSFSDNEHFEGEDLKETRNLLAA